MTAVAYVDAPALVKLVIVEPGSIEMLRWYVESERVVTSRVGIVETRRAAARSPHDGDALRALLASIVVVELDQRIADRAAIAGLTMLRALDVIHLATALELRDGLGAFVTCDDRLAAAARDVGLPVVRPD